MAKYLVEPMRLSQEDALIKWNQKIWLSYYQKSVLSKGYLGF